MRNRRDNRRDFDEREHPRDAQGRFVDDDEDNGGRYQGGYSRSGYGGRGYGQDFGEFGSARFGGGGQQGGYGEFRGGGLTRGSYERDYGGSEGGWGYPEQGQRSGTSRGRGMRGENWGGYSQDESGSESRRARDDDEYDPDYRHWRGEQMKKLDEDYDEWRQERRKKFSEDFDKWRSSRPAKGQTDQTSKK